VSNRFDTYHHNLHAAYAEEELQERQIWKEARIAAALARASLAPAPGPWSQPNDILQDLEAACERTYANSDAGPCVRLMQQYQDRAAAEARASIKRCTFNPVEFDRNRLIQEQVD
jgi:hypothetical protein